MDEGKIAEEERYDGLCAVCTDLLDDDGKDILKVSEGRWKIEECFRIMKTDFEARPTFVRLENRITAHFHFADIEGQGYMPLYKRERITDALHEVCGFRTDYQFITKQKMKEKQEHSIAATNIKYAFHLIQRRVFSLAFFHPLK